jgi:16S rRNA (cytidine1402-2'-O)-methyltransferase
MIILPQLMMHSLYLIPVPLSEQAENIYTIQYPLLNSIRVFITESVREARRNLRRIGYTGVFDDCIFYEWNKHDTASNDMAQWLKHCNNEDVALLSDAGCPAVADPGADVVALAHQLKIPVIPLIGPSSILLALMASGLNGQSFAFNGYLPVESKMRKEKLKVLEVFSAQHYQTQIFIETPYRNQALLNDILSALNDSTRLCIASGLTATQQKITTLTIAEWKKKHTVLGKTPAVFLFLSKG